MKIREIKTIIYEHIKGKPNQDAIYNILKTPSVASNI